MCTMQTAGGGGDKDEISVVAVDVCLWKDAGKAKKVSKGMCWQRNRRIGCM